MTMTPLTIDGEAVYFLDAFSASSAAAQGGGDSSGPSVPGPAGSGPSVPGSSVPGPSVPGTVPQGGGPGGTGGGEAPPPSSPFQSLAMFALIGAVIWFLIFAPERKARKKREEMLGAVKKGDRVVTTGGLHGQVVEVKEREVVLKAGDVRLTFSRSSIHEVVNQNQKDGDSDAS